LQELHLRRDELVEVERFRIERLLAGKGQQPLRQCGRTLRSAHGVVERALQAGRHSAAQAPEMALRCFQIADDDGEQIVEIVCHSAGELADGLHFLRLQQPLARLLELLLGQVPFRDIARHLGKADQLARIVVDRVDHHACPKSAATLADAPALGLVAAFSGRSLERARRHVFALVVLRVEP